MACTIGRTRPSAIIGHTCATVSATISAFSSIGRGRSNVPVTEPSAHQRVQVQLGLGAALHPDDDESAAWSEDREVRGEVLGADDVEHDVDGYVGEHLGEVLLAVVDDDVGAELAAHVDLLGAADRRGDACPEAVAIWMAVVPMPLAPPCTSIRWPVSRPPTMTMFDQTVHVVSISPPASTRSTPSGTGAT